MPAILTPIAAEQADAFRAGDERAFELLVRSRFDALVEKAGIQLGADAVAAPRVAMGVLLGAWADRARFATPGAIDDYLDEAVSHRAAEELRRRASLHRFELHEGVHVTTPTAKAGMTAQQAWDEIHTRLHVSAEELAEHREEARRVARRHAREHVDTVARRRPPMAMILGGVGLLVVAVLAMRWMDRGSAELALTRALEAEDVRTIYASPGQRGTISLLDESSAQLGATSTLRIPNGFGTAFRGLELDGAAHFVVAAGPSRNFQVRTRGAAIVATGTDFSVRAYDDDPELFVTVQEGTVRVHPVIGASSSRTLRAGESVAVARDGTMRTPAPNEVAVVFAWVNGELLLEDATVDHALTTLRRWHNLDATLDDPGLGARTVTTKLTLESSGQALDALTRAANLAVDYDGTRMVLRDAALMPKLPAEGAGRP